MHARCSYMPLMHLNHAMKSIAGSEEFASRRSRALLPGDAPTDSTDERALQDRAKTPRFPRHATYLAYVLLAVVAASCVASGWKHEGVAGLGSTSLFSAGADLDLGGKGHKPFCGMHCAGYGHQVGCIDSTRQVQGEVRPHRLLLLRASFSTLICVTDEVHRH